MLSRLLVIFVLLYAVQSLKASLRSELSDFLTERNLEEELKTPQKRFEHQHGLIFFFGDVRRDNKLDEYELTRLFSCDVFSSETDRLVKVLLSRDLNNDGALDVAEWEDIASMSRYDLAMMLLNHK